MFITHGSAPLAKSSNHHLFDFVDYNLTKSELEYAVQVNLQVDLVIVRLDPNFGQCSEPIICVESTEHGTYECPNPTGPECCRKGISGANLYLKMQQFDRL
jgi:hypothetical protein